MARYTIEDIEILRKKSGITYEEAVNLLEYHDGSLARALVDLERNGRMKGEGKNAPADNGFHGVVDFLLRLHLKITKGDTCIVYLNALVMIVAALAAPYVVLAGVILSWVLGYKVRLTRSASADSVEEMLKTVRKNVRQTVSRFTQETVKDFKRIFLKKGESQVVNFTITADKLKFYDNELNYICEPGEFDVMVGPNSRDVQKLSFTLQ